MQDGSLINIGIIEDEPVARDLLESFLLKNSMSVVAASGLTQFKAQAKSLQSPLDIILLDLNLLNEDGMDFFHDPTFNSSIREKGVGVIVLLARSSDVSRIDAISQGADDYLTKPYTFNELLARIHLLHLRLKPFLYSSERALIDSQLSQREKAVFVSVAQGHSLSNIANELNVSLKTAETYRSRISVKLEVKSISDITRLAAKAGLV